MNRETREERRLMEPPRRSAPEGAGILPSERPATAPSEGDTNEVEIVREVTIVGTSHDDDEARQFDVDPDDLSLVDDQEVDIKQEETDAKEDAPHDEGARVVQRPWTTRIR